MRITERTAKSAAVPSNGQAIYFDDDVKGFGVRVTSNGSRSWVVEVRREITFSTYNHRQGGRNISGRGAQPRN